MKGSPLNILAIKIMVFGIISLSTLPFLSIIAQYIDSVTGFSSGSGYYTNHMVYIFKRPLVYMVITFGIITILAFGYLIHHLLKAKRGES